MTRPWPPPLPQRIPGTNLPSVALTPQTRYVGRASVSGQEGRFADDSGTIERLANALRRLEV